MKLPTICGHHARIYGLEKIWNASKMDHNIQGSRNNATRDKLVNFIISPTKSTSQL